MGATNTIKIKGEGTIYKRKDGRWEYKYFVGTDTQTGKFKYKSFYGKTEKELKGKIREFNSDRKKFITEVITTTFREYSQHYMLLVKYPNLKPISYDRLVQTKDYVCDELGLGYMQLGKVETKDVQTAINICAKTKSYSTLKKTFQFINGVFKYAYATKSIDYNPCLAVELPKERNMLIQTKKVVILSQEETDKIYALNTKIQKNNNRFFKHLPGLLLLLNTGWRVGELLALDIKDIDLSTREAKISKTLTQAKVRDENGQEISKHKKMSCTNVKTEAGNRITPLNETAVQLIQQIMDYNKRNGIVSDHLICTENGGYVSERNMLRTFKSILGLIEASHDYPIHILRHTFASRLLSQGVEVSVVSELLGHSDINITYKTYVHVIESQKAKVMNSVLKI